MNNEAAWTRVGGSVTQLSLAISLHDHLTGGRPVGDPVVTVDGESPDARSSGGDHLYFGLPKTTVTVAVEPDERYVDEQRSVDLSTHDPADAETIDLVPTPAYDFPAWATVIRGRVLDASGDPVANSEMTVPDRTLTVRSDENGAFAYYVTEATKATVDRSGTTVIELGGGDPTVTATHPDGRTTSTAVTVEPSTHTTTTLQFS